MNTHDKIELPPLPNINVGGNDRKQIWFSAGEVDELRYAAIEADRQRRQSEAEEVCSEAYQVVGSLLSDLGIFETGHAKKILDNLGQAKMVHKDILPWPSFNCKRRGEPTAAEISDVIREITGCPDIKNGEDSLVVALGILFHRCATTQPAELDSYAHTVPDDCETLHWRGQILSLNELVAISAEPVKTLIDNQEPLGEEFQHVLDEHSWDLYVRTTEPVAYHSCTPILIEGLKRLPGGSEILAEWDRARSRVDAPQPSETVSTHHAHRGVESLPCYCNGEDDHPIGKETPRAGEGVPSDAFAHEIWAAAQTAPGEGVENAVERVAALLTRYGNQI